jgi:pyrimidine-nucleoside phosphorylase
MPSRNEAEDAEANASLSPLSFNPTHMIQARRQGIVEHDDEELRAWVKAYTEGTLPDYQMAAWLMAVCFHPLNARETATLTSCMVASGVRVDWTSHDAIASDTMGKDSSTTATNTALVDKHSTGGVGDKISIVLAPLVAAFSDNRVAVPMMAGRGLGHTGGTIDKLEAIPGFRTNLSVSEFQHVVRTVGCSIVAAGPELCPADQKLYALRDVTGTVSSLPLQTASIVSKKVAEHPDSLVLDCKYGYGAFQADVEAAETLANSMIAVAEANGLRPTTAFLTRMDAPLGYTVGNWVEIRECLAILRGNLMSQLLSRDVIALVVVQATEMLLQSGQFEEHTFENLASKVYTFLDQGKAFGKFAEMVQAQGGAVEVLQNPETYPAASTTWDLLADRTGFIVEINALYVGEATVDLGAGRKVANEPVDPLSGIVLLKKLGDSVVQGEVLAKILTNHAGHDLQGISNRLQSAIVIGDFPIDVPPIVSHRVTCHGANIFCMPHCLLKIEQLTTS